MAAITLKNIVKKYGDGFAAVNDVSIDIADGGEGLVVKLGPEPMTYALTHWDVRTYVLEPRDENNPDGSVSTLTFAPDGPRDRATSVTIGFLNGNGLGTFKRD